MLDYLLMPDANLSPSCTILKEESGFKVLVDSYYAFLDFEDTEAPVWELSLPLHINGTFLFALKM